MSQDQANSPHYNTINPFLLIKGGALAFIDFVVFVFDGIEYKGVRTPDRDGSIIHAEIQVGDAMLLIADSKNDWPFTPAFLQVYVEDAQGTLNRALNHGATLITDVSPFYNKLKMARIKDPWGNLWWIYEKMDGSEEPSNASDLGWHHRDPSYIYSSLMEAMRNL